MDPERSGRTTMLVGAACFIVGALAFVGVFSWLAASFDYPDILDGSAGEVLPRLRAGGTTMRAVWALYAFLPLFLLPGALGAQAACPRSPHRMRCAFALTAIATLCMCLGLMRWPSVHWKLAEAFEGATPDARISIAALFDGLNLYLGNYVGEFLGETTLAAFFFLAGMSMLRERYARWLGWGGMLFGTSFFTGAFRNVIGAVQPVADANNALLPLWMIALGASLAWYALRQHDARH